MVLREEDGSLVDREVILDKGEYTLPTVEGVRSIRNDMVGEEGALRGS